MHMTDALISPATGGALWVASGGLLAYCAHKVKQALHSNLIPLMGVLGAFIFAAQMVNFAIPLTGSSGHLGGGLILAILLGPYAAFLVIASILTIQAFFFADGGLLALGCNIFNLGFFPAFVAYPFIYRPIAGNERGTPRARIAAIVAAATGLLLGAFSVVLQTRASGISDLPFQTFALLMLSIHLAIGIVEGVATAAVVSFVARERPETLTATPDALAGRPALIALAIAAALLGGVATWFASTKPDGLEWSLARTTGQEDVAGSRSRIHQKLAALQKKTALLAHYGLQKTESAVSSVTQSEPESNPWPTPDAERSLSGIVGGAMTLALACLIGWTLKRRANTPKPNPNPHN